MTPSARKPMTKKSCKYMHGKRVNLTCNVNIVVLVKTKPQAIHYNRGICVHKWLMGQVVKLKHFLTLFYCKTNITFTPYISNDAVCELSVYTRIKME